MVVREKVQQKKNERVRAILLTDDGNILFIKRIKPGKPAYWVAPGGGVESIDKDLHSALVRELCEELGAKVEILGKAFVLEHQKAGKNLREYFFVCRLIDYDLSLRNGPEFDDPTRGYYVPVKLPLEADALNEIAIKTPELHQWLINNLSALKLSDYQN